jgi:hypothetical protein
MTAFYLGSDQGEDASMRSKAPLLMLVGAVIVLGQAFVGVGVMVGTSRVSCVGNDQCSKGRFCGFGTPEVAGRCIYCASEPPYILTDPATGGPGNRNPGDWYRSYGYDDSNITAIATEICADPTVPRQTMSAVGVLDVPEMFVRRWCASCVAGTIAGGVDMETFSTWSLENLAAMGMLDWLTVFLASSSLAAGISGELKDIELVLLQIKRAGDRVGTGWRIAVKIFCNIRRYLFLPALAGTMPVMIVIIGGDALVRKDKPKFANLPKCECCHLKSSQVVLQ